MFDNITDQVKALLGEVIRVGMVTSTNDEAGTARVQFKDRNGIVSYDLPVLVKNTLKNKDYWMPDIKEQVLCLFLSIGIEQGFIIGSYYSKVNKPTENTKNKRKTLFEDGTSVEYDRQSHTLTIDVPENGGNIVVNAHTKVTVNSPLIDLGESSSLEPSVLGNKLAAWVANELKPWLNAHNHISASSGNPTSPAQTGSFGPFNEGSAASGGAVYSAKNKNQ